MKEKLIEPQGKKVQNYTEISIPLSIINRTNTQKITKNMEDLHNTVNHIDTIDVFGALYLMEQNTYFFQVHIQHFPKVTIFWILYKS